jgi:hypothetical protein
VGPSQLHQRGMTGIRQGFARVPCLRSVARDDTMSPPHSQLHHSQNSPPPHLTTLRTSRGFGLIWIFFCSQNLFFFFKEQKLPRTKKNMWKPLNPQPGQAVANKPQSISTFHSIAGWLGAAAVILDIPPPTSKSRRGVPRFWNAPWGPGPVRMHDR